MILRFIVENLASFKDAVEFNTFPSSKSHSHENHKITCGYVTALRMSAIYGANGAGKSNLLSALGLLGTMVLNDGLEAVTIHGELPFKFDESCINKPSGLAVEFYYNQRIYYYHIEFNRERIFLEELYLSGKTKDIKLFVRQDSSIEWNGDYFAKGFIQQFVDGLERLVRPDMMVLPFMGKYYPDEMPLVSEAYSWFVDKLEVIQPGTLMHIIPQMFDSNVRFSELVNSLIPELKTGISRLTVRKEELKEENVKGNDALLRLIKQARLYPDEPQVVNVSGEVSNVVCENGKVYLKTLVPIHQTADGKEVEMAFVNESDGTRRLIDYMPLFYAVTNEDKVYVVDEIERSIHPILIKSIVEKLSQSEDASGQLIFTTHESGLLDQDIFRPDEIWFAQKDADQATQLYPLSDFNIHKTANIENGYLNGRYGGIPFLSNLKDLHW